LSAGIKPQAAVRFIVRGRVQGVFYRAATAERAADLGLDGWVRNLSDGRVEIVAAGVPEAIEALATWLWEGPPNASVSAVALEEWIEAVAPGFQVRR
jgi:acylphosphatase